MMNKINLVILTYNLENLKLSLPRLNLIDLDYNIIIHNDNPEVTLDESHVECIKDRGPIKLLNESENQGMFMSRIRCIDYLSDDAKWTMYLDDDDLLFEVDPECVETREPKLTNLAWTIVDKKLLTKYDGKKRGGFS